MGGHTLARSSLGGSLPRTDVRVYLRFAARHLSAEASGAQSGVGHDWCAAAPVVAARELRSVL